MWDRARGEPKVVSLEPQVDGSCWFAPPHKKNTKKSSLSNTKEYAEDNPPPQKKQTKKQVIVVNELSHLLSAALYVCAFPPAAPRASLTRNAPDGLPERHQQPCFVPLPRQLILQPNNIKAALAQIRALLLEALKGANSCTNTHVWSHGCPLRPTHTHLDPSPWYKKRTWLWMGAVLSVRAREGRGGGGGGFRRWSIPQHQADASQLLLQLAASESTCLLGLIPPHTHSHRFLNYGV